MEDQGSRAARLRALREAAGLDTQEAASNGAASETKVEEPVLKFRNYSVKDDKITHEKQAVANPPKYEQPVVESDVDVEGEVGNQQIASGQCAQADIVDSLLLLDAGAIAECSAKEAKLGFAQRCRAQAGQAGAQDTARNDFHHAESTAECASGSNMMYLS